MSICIISDHIIMLRQNFISYNTQHIDQVKPKYEGGLQPPKPPPPPPGSVPVTLQVISQYWNSIFAFFNLHHDAN